MSRPAVVSFEAVDLWHTDGTAALVDVNWEVGRAEHWAVLGPNGAGKSTLLGLACALRLPSRGRVSVLGATLGRVDLRRLRERIGVVDVRLRIPSELSVLDYVLTGATQTVVLREDRVEPRVSERATGLLEQVGLSSIARRRVGVCSHGERARARLARALLPDPELLVLDEPASGLDLPGRADLLRALTDLALADGGLTTVTAVHHLEELPPTTTHVVLIKEGRLLRSGPISAMLSDEDALSSCFDRAVRAFVVDGRWYAAAGLGP